MVIERVLAKDLAEKTHNLLIDYNDQEPMDGDQVEEFAVMVEEELNQLNGNV